MTTFTLIHIALATDGTVLAHFLNSADASAYCRDHECTHLPFNTANRDGEAAPAVGTIYRA